MSLTQTKQNVPALRFPKFSGGWEKEYLGAGVNLISGQHLSPNEYSKEVGKIPYFTGPSDFTNNTDQLTKWTIVSSKNAYAGDVLITVKGSGVGELWHLQLPIVAMGRQLMAVKGKTIRSDLVFQFLSTQRKYLAALAAGNMIPGLTRNDLLKIKVGLPSDVTEQQKIASFLSSVDHKIELLDKKKALLEQYKKGMMQKLFSQELRFNDGQGNGFPDWEEKRLGDVRAADKHSFTGGPFGSNLKSEEYTEFGVRIIQLQNIGDGKFIEKHKIYTSPEKADELKSCNIYPGEIIISKMGDPVARACMIPSERDVRYLMASDGIRLAVNQSKYNSKFIHDSINFRTFRNKAFAQSTGSTRKRIGLTELRNLTLSIPSIEEQQKIANFLSSIDKKIDLVTTELDQAKIFKKGLLQQMFI